MLQETPDSKGQLIALRVGGFVTKPEVEMVRQRLDAIEGKARVMLEIEGLVGATPAGFWEDLKLSLKHLRTVERTAIVADQRWAGWWAKGLSRALRAEIRHFRTSERDAALEWLRED